MQKKIIKTSHQMLFLLIVMGGTNDQARRVAAVVMLFEIVIYQLMYHEYGSKVCYCLDKIAKWKMPIPISSLKIPQIPRLKFQILHKLEMFD